MCVHIFRTIPTIPSNLMALSTYRQSSVLNFKEQQIYIYDNNWPSSGKMFTDMIILTMSLFNRFSRSE